MNTDRVIVEILTVANTGGIAQAKAAFMGFNPTLLIATAAIGGLIAAGKSAVDISREHEKAENELSVAIKNRGVNAKRVQDELYAFIQANRDVITNQSDVINSTAALVREGVSYNNIKRDQTLILDLAAAKNIDVATATSLVTKAEAGQFRGLKDLLGITIGTSKAHDTLAQKQKVVNDNLDRAAQKVAGAAKAVDPLEKAFHRLGNDWQDLANKGGPALEGMIAGLVNDVSDLYDALNRIGQDDALWARISKRVTDLAGDLRRLLIQMGIAQPEPSDFGLKPTFKSPATQSTAGMTPAQYAAFYKTHIGGGGGPGSAGLTPAQFKAQFDKEQAYYKHQLAEQARQTKLLKVIADKAPPVIQIYAQPGTQVTATRRIVRQITAI